MPEKALRVPRAILRTTAGPCTSSFSAVYIWTALSAEHYQPGMVADPDRGYIYRQKASSPVPVDA